MKTYVPRAADIERAWLVVDAANVPIGRLASQVAALLRGKHKVHWTPHLDMGDNVIVINALQVKATGKKEQTKKYYRHSGYPGGLKTLILGALRERHPEHIVKRAVKPMLPKGPLGKQMFKKLRVYAGSQHPHEAQQPKAFPLLPHSKSQS